MYLNVGLSRNYIDALCSDSLTIQHTHVNIGPHIIVTTLSYIRTGYICTGPSTSVEAMVAIHCSIYDGLQL